MKGGDSALESAAWLPYESAGCFGSRGSRWLIIHYM
jgi:hypothetical protein